MASLNWMSQLIAANETVLLAGGGFNTSSVVQLTRPGMPTITTNPLHVSEVALSFILPAAVSSLSWGVTVDGSNELWLNAPEIWWWQGDLGVAASVGGQLRVFGRALAMGASLPTLRLRHIGSQQWGAPVVASSASAWHATFPMTLAPGAFEAELQGGGDAAAAGWIPLVSFTAPAVPRDRLVEVRGSSRAVFGQAIFDVGDFCRVGSDCGVVGTNSSWAVLRALEAAGEVGGGTVQLPRGQWYLNHSAGDLRIPPNVLLRGEATDLTAIYFPEQQKGEAPWPAYLHTTARTAGAAAPFAWAVEDLTLYISHFYEGVVHCGTDVDGFSMRRVRCIAQQRPAPALTTLRRTYSGPPCAPSRPPPPPPPPPPTPTPSTPSTPSAPLHHYTAV